MMTPEEVTARVLEIGQIGALDSEKGHAAEDALYVDVLTTIARGNIPSVLVVVALAREALRSRQADFPRWAA